MQTMALAIGFILGRNSQEKDPGSGWRSKCIKPEGREHAKTFRVIHQSGEPRVRVSGYQVVR